MTHHDIQIDRERDGFNIWCHTHKQGAESLQSEGAVEDWKIQHEAETEKEDEE